MSDTPRCEPRKEHQVTLSRHWVEDPDGTQRLAIWWGKEWHGNGANGLHTPESWASQGIRYIAPVATPSEVEALHTRIVGLTHAMELAVYLIMECPDAPRDPTSLPEAVKAILLEALQTECKPPPNQSA